MVKSGCMVLLNLTKLAKVISMTKQFSTDCLFDTLKVICNQDNSLLALEAGRVEVTMDPIRPYPHSNYARLIKRDGGPINRKYYHVIPDPQEKRFKLVSQV